MERYRGMPSACVSVPSSASEGLETLRASGVLTDEEFQQAKQRLLNQ
jgi:hypothetical protein